MWHQKYSRIPFKSKGRALTLEDAIKNGLDCWGLICLVFLLELGIVLPSYVELYHDTEDAETICAIMLQERARLWRDVDRPEAFDVIGLLDNGTPTHMAIAISGNQMLHCQKGCGTVIQGFPSMRWPSNRILGFARYAGSGDTSEHAN